MSQKQTFLKDKPYGFVPLLGTCRRKPLLSHQEMNAHTYSGKLFLKITVESPLHIGSGRTTCDSEGNIVKTTMRRNGRGVIPGSSIKGAVRAIAEAVSYSCAVKLPDSKVKKLVEALPETNKKSCSFKELCPSCSIFGTIAGKTGYKGKVNFGEFVCRDVSEEKAVSLLLPALESPFKDYPSNNDLFNRKGYGNERLYYCRACSSEHCEDCSKENYFEHVIKAGKERDIGFRGRKFYLSDACAYGETKKKTFFEVMEPSSILRGEIIFQNMRREELQLLAYALDIQHFFRMKLGYGKPLGYGNVNIDLEDVEEMRIGNKKEQGLKKEDIESFAVEYRENSPDDIREAMRHLERIMG